MERLRFGSAGSIQVVDDGVERIFKMMWKLGILLFVGSASLLLLLKTASFLGGFFLGSGFFGGYDTVAAPAHLCAPVGLWAINIVHTTEKDDCTCPVTIV